MSIHRLRLLALAGVVALVPLAGTAHAQSSNDLFKGFQTKSDAPVNVEADSLDVSEKDGQRVSVFSGNVTVTRGDTVLRAGSITLYSRGSADKGADKGAKPTDVAAATTPTVDNFSRIEANGKVYVSSGEQTATGDNAVVDMIKKVITLSGDVVLSQGKNVLTGDRLTFDMTTGRARVEQKPGARVRGVFTPNNAAQKPQQ